MTRKLLLKISALMALITFASVAPSQAAVRISLHKAAEDGMLGVVKGYIKYEHDINKPDENGDTPLILAAEQGHTDVVDLLLENKADPNIHGSDDMTALIRAAAGGHNEIVKKLIEAGAQVDATEQNFEQTALHFAIKERGNIETVTLLLDHGANPNHATSDGDTPLTLAASDPDHTKASQLVELLLSRGADVNHRGFGGRTALMEAAGRGYVDITKRLLQEKPDLTIKDDKDLTAMDWAKKLENNNEVIALLDGTDAGK